MSGNGQGNGATGIPEIVGANIRAARQHAGLKQRQLAAVLEMSPQHLSDWERGAYKPNDDNLSRLSTVLERDFAWFFTDHSAEMEHAA